MTDTKDDKVMRSFDTGATRDTADGKLDMEGFTHPMVEKQFAKYMNMNRLQSDGQLRDSDNWQKGIPMDAYIKSLRRHHDDVWLFHRGFKDALESGSIIAALCGTIFNAQGYLLEYLKSIDFLLQDFDGVEPTPEMRERQGKLNTADIDMVSQRLVPFIPDDCDLPDISETPEDDLYFEGTKIYETVPVDEVVQENPEAAENPPPSVYAVALAEMLDDFLAPTVSAMEDWNEDLEEVPELPVCFGDCGATDCYSCKDKPECDTTECCTTDCEFSVECAEDFSTNDDGDEICSECATVFY